jgi:hypothetical protein
LIPAQWAAKAQNFTRHGSTKAGALAEALAVPVTRLQAIPEGTVATFLEYAKDAGNWSDRPWVNSGNIQCTTAMGGHISNMVQLGLVRVVGTGRDTYMEFTVTGVALAAQHGVTVRATA